MTFYKTKNLAVAFFLALACLWVFSEEALSGALDKLIANGGFIVTKDDKIIAARNPDKLFVPASTWKIATSLAALKILGPDYRFFTTFYQDANHNLYIKGNGDPFLISEEVDRIITILQTKQVNRINDIYLDDSVFADEPFPDGAGNSLNPYDVANGAIAVNFNTVNFKVAADGSISSAESQTPTLPLMRKLGRGLPTGIHRINISLDKKNVLINVGELFRALQQIHHIPGSGLIKKNNVPSDLTPIYTHYSSKKMERVIEGLLLYSNNFIVNQLFLTLGAKKYGYPATWSKGKAALKEFLLSELNITDDLAQVAEGSGLSRHNRITPRTMLKLLNNFKPYAHLLPSEKGRLIKSGTLTDVFCYVGYFQTAGRLDSFVLFLNQPGNHRDKIINILEKIHNGAS